MKQRFLLALIVLGVTGCASYRTPGAGISPAALAAADEDIAEIMAREPTAAFPANVAIVRAQASGYSNRSSGCYGVGSFCVVTVRDVESEEDFQRLLDLPMIAGVAPMNRILLPVQLQSLRDLRTAAAQLKTDMLLVYSFDTRFRVETDDVGPLQTIALGFLPTREAQVSTTASAALFDVRTGFLYGVAEATAREEQRASMWSTESAVDSARERTETESFKLLVTEFRKLWKQVVETHAVTPSGN